MGLYDVKLISKVGDFNCCIRSLNATSSGEAESTAVRMMTRPDAWLVVSVSSTSELPISDKECVDLYVAKRAEIRELSREARQLSDTFSLGRTEGSVLDVRTTIEPSRVTYSHHKSTRRVTYSHHKSTRRVAIVPKLKPKKPKTK